MATFAEAKMVKCPLCHADIGAKCVSVNLYYRWPEMTTLHNERLRAVNDARKKGGATAGYGQLRLEI